MRIYLLLAILVCSLLTAGCYAPLIEGAQEGYDAGRRDSLKADAGSDDPIAQFHLGDTYCCHGGGPMDEVSIYDNHKATYWYCRSAKQGYGPAQMRLANIYSGHPIHGLHVALRASALVGNADTDYGIGLLWASVAASHGVEDATALRDKIAERATDKERVRTAELMKNWRAAPCRWAEVFPLAKAPG